MNLKNMLLYQLYDNKKPLFIFYTVIISLMVFISIMNASSNSSGSLGGMEMSSVIFIFILGLNSFKSNFHFSLANGISRKTQFISFMGSIITIAVFMALIDTVLGVISSQFIPNQSLYFQVYSLRYGVTMPVNAAVQMSFQLLSEGFLWFIFLYAMMAMLGYCITLIYYRSSKPVKYLVSILPAALVFILFPFINRMTDGRLVVNLAAFVGRIMGFGQSIGVNPNPYISMLSFTIGFAILALFSFLLARRAVIKQ